VTLTHCIVDLARRRVLRDSQQIELTAREADLLQYLAANPSRTISRDELLSQVWGYADTVVSRACDNTVRRLREKIEGDASRPDHVLTVHGTGYRFEPGSPSAEAATGSQGEPRLTAPEAAVLAALRQAQGAVVSSEELTRKSGAAVARSIHGLRRKLGHDVVIDTARGGYRLVLPDAAPEPRDALIGREDLLHEARSLGAQAGWLLLVGPAGVGKSRLARELAPHALWVDLAAADTLQAASVRVARALGLEPGGGDPIEQVGMRLERQPVAMVLDNLEQLGTAAIALIERWSRPGVRLIGTSRRRLGARGEVVIEVGPLSQADAVALFEARARAASPAFRASPPDRRAIGELVDRIDRFPLAIELLAARTTVLGVEDLRRRVSAELLVQPSSRDRHHSVEVLVRTSIAELPRPSQADLAQLALFRGGFTVDDAEAVLGPDAVDRLQVLRDHCLLHRLPDRHGHARFDTWQLVHELLERASEPEPIRRYCERLARWGAQPEAIGWIGAEAELDEMAASVDELVRAADAALGLGDPELAARCAIPALSVLMACGPFATGLALADRVLAADPPAVASAHLQYHRAHLLRMNGAIDDALEGFHAARASARRADRPDLEARAWTTIGTLELYHMRPSARASLAEAAAAWARTLEPGGWEALCEARIRWLEGDNEATRAAAARALASAQQRGDRMLIVMTSALMIDEAAMDGRLADADAAAAAELAASHFGVHRVIALGHRLNLALFAADLPAIERWSEELAAAAEPLASRFPEAWLLRARAESAGLRGQWEEADRALDEAFALQGQLGSVRDVMILQRLRADLARRRGDVQEALRWARLLHDSSRQAAPEVIESAACELGLTLLAAGDLAGSRAALRAAPPLTHRVGLLLRLAWQAVLAAAEGERDEASRLLVALREEVIRSGTRLPGDPRACITSLIGAWAADLLDGTVVPAGGISES
jgi:DNA-binding response OmpR family regulator/tetratricopeptide (TPR) repeat protein